MRLIDADALQALFNEVSTSLLSKAELHKDAEHMVRAFLMTTEMIQDAPMIDAVLVVRCKDCTHYREYMGRDMCAKNATVLDGREVGLRATGKDEFCSYGARTEGAE